MAMVNTESRLTDEYVSYNEAASLLGVTRGTVDRAVNTCILTAVRLPGVPRNKFIPRFEIEALKGLNVNSRRAKEHLDQVRRERSMGEKEFNEDGTDRWVPSSELDKLVEEVRIMKERQEQIAKEQQEVIAKMNRAAEHLLSMTPEKMFKYIADNMKEPAVE